MNHLAREFLFRLLKTPSPSGFESEGQRVWTDYVRQWADAVETDTYGTAWAVRNGAGGESAPVVMLEAHAAEIGFMVQYITDDGYLHVGRIGGMDRATARGKRVQILGSNGPVTGILGNTAIHIRETKAEKVPELHQLFVDVGASSREEVLERGVRVGHPMVYADEPFELTPGRLTGRALDNRVGSFIIASVLERIASGDRLDATVCVANCVQEEIGGHGARMLSYRLDPDVAVVLDVTHATDSPGIDKTKHGSGKLGEGPTVTHGRANHVSVVERLEYVAAESKIPLQHEAASVFTGTDTDDIFNSRKGIPSALISLPMRYMHSSVETVDLQDVERCVDLLVRFAASVKDGEAFRVDI